MDKLIERLSKLVAEHSRQVLGEGQPLAVDPVGGAENMLFEITCNQGDVGLIIGKKGRNIEAIRTLVRSACRGANVRTSVEVCNSRG